MVKVLSRRGFELEDREKERFEGSDGGDVDGEVPRLREREAEIDTR